jgi:hypothetical protein
MAEVDERLDEELAEQLLGTLRDDEPEAPPDLPGKTIQRINSLLTARDLIDLTTVVFVLQFFAPILDLIAAMIGRDLSETRRTDEP